MYVVCSMFCTAVAWWKSERVKFLMKHELAWIEMVSFSWNKVRELQLEDIICTTHRYTFSSLIFLNCPIWSWDSNSYYLFTHNARREDFISNFSCSFLVCCLLSSCFFVQHRLFITSFTQHWLYLATIPHLGNIGIDRRHMTNLPVSFLWEQWIQALAVACAVRVPNAHSQISR